MRKRFASIAIAEAAIKSAMRNSTADVAVVGFIVSNASKSIQFIVQSMNLSGESGKPPRGLIAFGVFLLWGASMAFLAAVTLTWRGTLLDRVWAINPTGHQQLAPFEAKAGILFALLGITLTAAGVGWLRLVWAWYLAVAIIATQVIGNIASIFQGRTQSGGVSAPLVHCFSIYFGDVCVPSLGNPGRSWVIVIQAVHRLRP